jgi:hypothetical protein
MMANRISSVKHTNWVERCHKTDIPVFGNAHTALTHLNNSIDVDDHVSVVFNALAAVGNSELVSGVNWEVHLRPGGREGHLSCGSRFLCGGLGPYLLGGHGVFAVVPDCIVVVVVFVIIVVVAIGGALFTVFWRTREGNMLDNLDIKMK